MKKRIITLALALLVLSAMLTTAAFADGGAIPGCSLLWVFSGNTLTITGTGAMADFDTADDVPWKANNAAITAISIADTVTSIGNNAFAGANVTTMTIPKSVTAVGTNALPTALTGVTIPCKLESSLSGITAAKTVTHDVSEVSEKPATYTETGLMAHWKCKDCPKLFTDKTCAEETTEAKLTIAKVTDNTDPTLTKISISRETVNPSGSVDVLVNASDDASGIAGGSITFTNFSKTGSPSVSTALTANGDVLSGTLNFAATAASGEYYVSSVTIVDNANNDITYTVANLASAYQSIKITVKRDFITAPTVELGFNTTSVGYGGTVVGTVVLKDIYGNAIANKTLDIYVGTAKANISATTDQTGTATFKYSNTIPGTYTLKASFPGDDDYAASDSSAVNVTFTNVPSTGDHYDVQLWGVVAVVAIFVNVWFIMRRKKA